MRILALFDIDGTLVSGGPAKEAFRVALMDAFGTTGDIEVHDFAGKTDPQIARELLTQAGLSREEVDRGMPILWTRYLEELEDRLSTRPMEVLPGVFELLRALESVGEVVLGLVTGNIAGGARLKLGSAGLVSFFTVGGYGSDDEHRQHLPAIAIERAGQLFGVDFQGHRTFVIGDTPRDIACGLHQGVRTVAVATGRYSVEDLQRAGAHAVFPDFSDTGEVVASILGE